VILREELTKRAFWRLGVVTELITGNDNITRAVIVKTVNSDRTRSIKHIIPVELNTIIETDEDSSVKKSNMIFLNRRRAAAIREEKHRRLNTNN